MGEGISSFFFHSQKIKRKCGLLFQDLPPPHPVALGWGQGALVVLPGYPSPLLAVADFLP